jgi:hypothetical protein
MFVHYSVYLYSLSELNFGDMSVLVPGFIREIGRIDKYMNKPLGLNKGKAREY